MFAHEDARPQQNGTDQGRDIPMCRTLDAFVAEPGCIDGVSIQDLDAGTRLTVVTRRSCYRFVVLNGSERRAMVMGGEYFPDRTEVHVDGSTAGGSAIKMGWIGVGLCMELSSESRCITTSPVRSVHLDPAQPGHVC